jgi:hypothetical protein
MENDMTITIADRYAALKAAADDAAKALDALKAEIKAMGVETFVGITCDLKLCLSEQKRVDNTLLKQFLSEEQIEACKKPILVETIRIKPKGITE